MCQKTSLIQQKPMHSSKVVEVMKETGNDLPSLYKETGEGGLAKIGV